MKGKTAVSPQRDGVTKKDLQAFKDEIIQQFHIISEGLLDQIKLLAEGHSGIIQRLDRIEEENKHEHLETRALIKISFSQLDRRISDLESQMKEVQEWKKQVQVRLQV
jgi:delta-aminolevulinic acid dehydratase/porphobilinogen synthase